MKKYDLEDIEKIYEQCGISVENINTKAVKLTQIPNTLNSNNELNYALNKVNIKTHEKFYQ